jgi:hypothetical protein
MHIHKSHSKKELIEIADFFRFPIDDLEELSKPDLIMKMKEAWDKVPEIIPDYDILLVNNKDELKEYLQNQNQDKALSVNQRNKIMRKSKRIINYCKGGYNLIKSSFCSMSDLLDQANDVAMHGNIPTCRRAIRLLNMDIKIPYTIEVKMSNKIKRELELKKQLSLMYGTQGLIVKKGKVIVEFD